MVEVHSILDLMSSEDFDASELGKAITLFKMADIVAMLSNTINMWKREIIERDTAARYWNDVRFTCTGEGVHVTSAGEHTGSCRATNPTSWPPPS